MYAARCVLCMQKVLVVAAAAAAAFTLVSCLWCETCDGIVVAVTFLATQCGYPISLWSLRIPLAELTVCIVCSSFSPIVHALCWANDMLGCVMFHAKWKLH